MSGWPMRDSAAVGVWSQDDARELVTRGVRVATCWDVAAVHRLLFGGAGGGQVRVGLPARAVAR